MSATRQPWPPVESEPIQRHPDAPEPGSKLGMHYEGCFGCGDQPEHGLRLTSTAGEGLTVRSQFTVTREHQGAPGLAHGGLLACAFDEALGSAVASHLRVASVTGKLETDFRRPVPVDSTLHIIARVDGRSGRKIYVSADGHLGGEDGPIAVSARALFITVKLDHFTTHGDADSIEALKRTAARKPDPSWNVNP